MRGICVCVAAMLVLDMSAAHAADVLGVSLGDSPRLAATKLREYAETTYGDAFTRSVAPGEVERARKTVREGGDADKVGQASDLLAHSTIEVGGAPDADGHPMVQYIAANLLPFREVLDTDHESITVAFSGFASGNVAFKVQRYLVFKKDNWPAIAQAAPAGVKGMIVGVGVDALRNALVQSFGAPSVETDAEIAQYTDTRTNEYHYAEQLKVLAYRLDDAGLPDHRGGGTASALAPCIANAEHADLASRRPSDAEPQQAKPVDVSGCPALLLFQIHSPRGELASRFDEFLVDFPRLKSLSDRDAEAAKRAEAAVAAVKKAGAAERGRVKDAQYSAALHGPVALRY